MKKGHFITSLFAFFASFIMMIFLSCGNIEALYDGATSNKVVDYTVDKQANTLKISIQYQYGVSNVQVYVCHNAVCGNDKYITKFVDSALSGSKFAVNMTNDATAVYNGEYSAPYDGMSLNSYTEKIDSKGNANNNYYIVATAKFCEMRTDNLAGCAVWSDETKTILNEEFTMLTGITGNTQINETLANILYAVNDVVMPILWVGLGVLLIIRGVMIGIDIVKSADEPEVRKRKITGLVWLIIGIVVGYAVTISVSYVMSIFGFGGYFK